MILSYLLVILRNPCDGKAIWRIILIKRDPLNFFIPFMTTIPCRISRSTIIIVKSNVIEDLSRPRHNQFISGCIYSMTNYLTIRPLIELTSLGGITNRDPLAFPKSSDFCKSLQSEGFSPEMIEAMCVNNTVIVKYLP